MASPEFHKLVAYMAANPMPPVDREAMRRNMAAFGSNAKLPEGVMVDTSAIILGPPRGTDTLRRPRSGPFCVAPG